jgi:hypothetical protein
MQLAGPEFLFRTLDRSIDLIGWRYRVYPTLLFTTILSQGIYGPRHLHVVPIVGNITVATTWLISPWTITTTSQL